MVESKMSILMDSLAEALLFAFDDRKISAEELFDKIVDNDSYVEFCEYVEYLISIGVLPSNERYAVDNAIEVCAGFFLLGFYGHLSGTFE
jgi:hypothetical protein